MKANRVERFFLERRSAWEQFNTYLAKNGWGGITQPAMDRIPPFAVKMDRDWFSSKDIFHRWDALEQPDFLIIGSRTEKSDRSLTLEEVGSRYRYKKQD